MCPVLTEFQVGCSRKATTGSKSDRASRKVLALVGARPVPDSLGRVNKACMGDVSFLGGFVGSHCSARMQAEVPSENGGDTKCVLACAPLRAPGDGFPHNFPCSTYQVELIPLEELGRPRVDAS